ncbi:MAG TPA: NADH-quinone oxidoreductase subunit A, partial [Planctomycetaceae bacterium]|nr:NADH-quinone oxidoreductase subunit A [Planctomycetaceae bacterium]
ERLLSLPAGQLDAAAALPADAALRFGWMAFADLLVFFAVLLVGFAYVWKRGDLDWVRALSRQVAAGGSRPSVRPTALHR